VRVFKRFYSVDNRLVGVPRPAVQVHNESPADIPRRPQLSRADGANVPRDGGEDGTPPSAASQPGRRLPGLHGRRRSTMAAGLRRQRLLPAATLRLPPAPGILLPFLLYFVILQAAS